MKTKSLWQRAAALLAVLAVFSANAFFACAAGTAPDLTRKGSITITLRDQKKNTTVTGGELTLYQVAEAVQQNADYSFQYTNGFENCGVPLDNINDGSLAETLNAKRPATAAGIAKTVDAQGRVRYDDLAAGLYLIVQTKESANYETIAPFLVSVPMQEDGVWVYDVDATPKVGTVTSKTPDTPTPMPTPNTPNTPDTPVTPGTPTTPTTANRLPQTGQLNWPIPVLCVGGMLLLALGWFLRKDENEQ